MRRMIFALLLGMLVAMVFAGTALALYGEPTPERDKLIGTPDADAINALGGDDRVWAIGGGTKDPNRSPVYDEIVQGGTGGDTLYGDQDPALYLTPRAIRNLGFNGVVGDPGSDKLQGGNGPDKLYGDQGDDYLGAGKGEPTQREDVLTGGDGADEFWVDRQAYEDDIDRITDFQDGVDELHFYE